MARLPPKKDILILGGSYTGVSIAHYLLKHGLPTLPSPSSYRIVLLSASSQILCRPACPRALISDAMFPQDKLFVQIEQQFKQYNKEKWTFVHANVTEVDHTARVVTVLRSGTGEKQLLNFHALVIATGAATPSPLLGLNTDETALRETWKEFRKALPLAKSIVVAGGGPAGVEVAGELGEHLNGRARWFASRPENPKVAITLVASGADILPALRPSIAEKAEQYLASVGVVLIKNARVEAVSPSNAGMDLPNLVSKVNVTISNGTTLEADLYIPATGTTPNTSFLSPSLLDSNGRIITNSKTLRVEAAGVRVYAAGDASNFASKPAIHHILNVIPILGANMKRDLLLEAQVSATEVGVDRVFEEDTRETQLVPIGKKTGVGAAMGWRLPSWLVWMIKGRDYWLWTTGKQFLVFRPTLELTNDTQASSGAGNNGRRQREDLGLTSTKQRKPGYIHWLASVPRRTPF